MGFSLVVASGGSLVHELLVEMAPLTEEYRV